MSLHVIVGAGLVGSTTARLLAARGEQVRVLSRRGTGPVEPGIERIAADATDPERLSELTAGAAALYNCANAQYERWLTDWPPMATAILTAVERSGAVLATASNLYGYGPVDGAMSESTPLAATHPKLRIRADMWCDALAAHGAGRIRATEVRASDYIEANSILSFALAKPLLAGKRAYAPAALDQPHSFTAVVDVPTNAPITVRQLSQRFTEVAGAPKPKLTAIPYPVLWSLGLFSPTVRELRTTRYQFDRPFVLDSHRAQETFGIAPTPLDEVLASTVAATKVDAAIAAAA